MSDSARACPRCGSPNRVGAQFCSACGQRLVQPSCPACGEPVDPPQARFCQHCGQELATSIDTVAVTRLTSSGKDRPDDRSISSADVRTSQQDQSGNRLAPRVSRIALATTVILVLGILGISAMTGRLPLFGGRPHGTPQSRLVQGRPHQGAPSSTGQPGTATGAATGAAVTGGPATLRLPHSVLVILSTPADAQILIDDVAVKPTPYTLDKATPGPHTIVVKKPGYAAERQKIMLTPGEKFVLDVVLTRFYVPASSSGGRTTTQEVVPPPPSPP